jgi:hypothetical protein
MLGVSGMLLLPLLFQSLGEGGTVLEDSAHGIDRIIRHRLDQHTTTSGVRHHHHRAGLESDDLAQLRRNDDLPLG